MDEIMQDDMAAVQSIVKENPSSVHHSSLSGQTPLATALQWGRDECCAALLDVCPTLLDVDHGTPAVHLVVCDAAQSGHPMLAGLLRCVQVLANYNADFSCRDAAGSTVLERVLEEGCLETARCLLEAKVN